MTREDIIRELKDRDVVDKVKVRFFKESPYMKNRYKKEYVTSEAWIYHKAISGHGNLIREKDFNNKKIRDSFFDMVAGEVEMFKP